jgi:protein TonB
MIMKALRKQMKSNSPCSFWVASFLVIALAFAAQAQQAAPEAPNQAPRMIFTVADQPPQFPGGDDSLKAYLEKNLQVPSDMGKKNKAQSVSTTFIVTQTGKIENIRILKSSNKSLNAEAIRVIENMPAWIPARQRGNAVAFEYKLPIQFSKKQD